MDTAGHLALLLSACLLTSSAFTQTSSLQQHIDGAVAILQQLDDLANACLTSLEQAAELPTGEACAEFLGAIDGELLAQYLSHCEALTSWRELYVTEQFVANPDADNANPDLAFLVGTEYACGDDALQKRTGFVTVAFNLLQQGSTQERQNNTAINRRIAEMQFDATLNAERRLLLQSVQQQQLQRERESERQLRQIENELIRQQRIQQNQ